MYKYEVIKFDVNKLYTENSFAPKLRVILESAKKCKVADICFKEEILRGIPVFDMFDECRKELELRNYGYDIIVHNKICYLCASTPAPPQRNLRQPSRRY